MQSIESALQETALAIEQVLDQILTLENAAEMRLFDAMRYATLGGGKRFRPFLTRQCAGFGEREADPPRSTCQR